jgi:hypothetical protein
LVGKGRQGKAQEDGEQVWLTDAQPLGPVEPAAKGSGALHGAGRKVRAPRGSPPHPTQPAPQPTPACPTAPGKSTDSGQHHVVAHAAQRGLVRGKEPVPRAGPLIPRGTPYPRAGPLIRTSSQRHPSSPPAADASTTGRLPSRSPSTAATSSAMKAGVTETARSAVKEGSITRESSTGRAPGSPRTGVNQESMSCVNVAIDKR